MSSLSITRSSTGRGIKTEPGQEYIPLLSGMVTEEDRKGRTGSLVVEVETKGETQQDYLNRKTREFNEETRRHPYDIDLWLDYAKFQEEYLSLGKQIDKKVSKSLIYQAMLEKKLMILEKAMEFNPEEEDLLLAMLRTSQELYEYYLN